jgi:DNA replicative helicase MCM subunit Mcm2 (Cdc46/Mcm family)
LPGTPQISYPASAIAESSIRNEKTIETVLRDAINIDTDETFESCRKQLNLIDSRLTALQQCDDVFFKLTLSEITSDQIQELLRNITTISLEEYIE